MYTVWQKQDGPVVQILHQRGKDADNHSGNTTNEGVPGYNQRGDGC